MRDPGRSAEPRGGKPKRRPLFVVQRHDGSKRTGGFALTHTRMRGDDRNWLLVKIDDDAADRRRKPTSTQNESVLSGRTNDDL